MLAAAMRIPARVLLFHNQAGLFPPSEDKLDEPKTYRLFIFVVFFFDGIHSFFESICHHSVDEC